MHSLVLRRSIGALLGLGAAALLLFALQGTPAGASRAHASKTQKLKLKASASGALKFNKTRLTAHKGKITIVMTNPSASGLPHGIAVEGHGVDKDGKIVQSGHTSRVTVTLKKKGTYEFYCPVKGHKAAGMEGKLVVR